MSLVSTSLIEASGTAETVISDEEISTDEVGNSEGSGSLVRTTNVPGIGISEDSRFARERLVLTLSLLLIVKN
jgi:hypothetical protein